MQVYDRLQTVAQAYPISGNKGGSYTTIFSIGAFEINLIYVSSLSSLQHKFLTSDVADDYKLLGCALHDCCNISDIGTFFEKSSGMTLAKKYD